MVVSFATVFWMSRHASPKETMGGAWRDIQKTAAKVTRCMGELNQVFAKQPLLPCLGALDSYDANSSPTIC